ncbi:MAG: flagellar hook-associated protein FlgK [Legionellaceae bacterium]|nr:flagellar hook-associated protein FlgK [Legionellaceae bacterium]
MAGILGIANSALNAFQQGLAVTGNNIANVNTKGYSRQTIHYNTGPSNRHAGSFIGSGVTITGVMRNSDRFANEQVRDTQSMKSQYETFFQQASQLDRLLSQDGTGVSVSMQEFFNALSQLNDAPDNIGSRNVVLNQSRILAEQYNQIQRQIDEYQRNNGQQLQESVTIINQLSTNISEINQKLSATPDAPELLDQRDDLIRQLSELVDVSVLEQDNGVVNIAIGRGEMLVLGSDFRELSVDLSASGQEGSKILMNNGSGRIDISENMQSGVIGGLLNFEKDVLTPASQLLGQMAIGMAMVFNEQHQLGMDMNDQLGKNFFTDFNRPDLQLARSTGAASNTGNAVLAVAIEDIGQTKISDYELRVSDTGSNEVRVLRKSDGQSFTLNWTDNPPAPPAGEISLDGMRIQVDNISELTQDDIFNITATRGAAAHLALQIHDPREIAFAAPVRTLSSIDNSGNATIQLGQVFNTDVVSQSFRVEFINATEFNLINVSDGTTTGPLSYTPNEDNIIMIPDSVDPSYSIVISGSPLAGDTFSMDYNQGGIADNRNGLLLNNLQRREIFENGQQSLFDRHSNLIAQVGSQTYQAQLRAGSADILHQQALDFRESKSGVNLDEEAANLLRFQQAYQAAGKLLTVANDMFAVLFSSLR